MVTTCTDKWTIVYGITLQELIFSFTMTMTMAAVPLSTTWLMRIPVLCEHYTWPQDGSAVAAAIEFAAVDASILAVKFDRSSSIVVSKLMAKHLHCWRDLVRRSVRSKRRFSALANLDKPRRVGRGNLFCLPIRTAPDNLTLGLILEQAEYKTPWTFRRVGTFRTTNDSALPPSVSDQELFIE